MCCVKASPAVPGRSGGFTLLEMLVVLAITGLIAGLLYPQMQTATFVIQQRQAREQVSAGAEAARAVAFRTGAPTTLSAQDRGAGLVVSTSAGIWRQFPLAAAASLRLALRPQSIVFYPDGSTTGGAIQLGTIGGSSQGTSATYIIDRESGRMHLAGADGT
jgi:hypothetical protein